MSNEHGNLKNLFTDIASAIREKTGNNDSIIADAFPRAIRAIERGVDTSDATAIAEEIFQGKTAYAQGHKVTGTFTIDEELNTQDDLITQITTALENKAILETIVVDDVSKVILDKTVTNIEDNTLTYLGTYALYNCYSLSTVSFPACKEISTRAFAYCRNLTTADFPSCTDIGSSAFANCHNLPTASFPACVNIDTNAFTNCRILSILTLDTSSVCTLTNSNAFSSTPFAGYKTYFSGTPHIFVPMSLITAYRSATNWTYFSSCFYTIESIEGGAGE